MNTLLKKQILEQLDRLPEEQQRRTLDFVRSLGKSERVGVPGKDLLRFAGLIEPDDLKLMEQAIEEECERIDADEWRDAPDVVCRRRKTMVAAKVYEGTWDELATHADELRAYAKLTLIALPESGAEAGRYRAEWSAEERIRAMDAFAEKNRGLPRLSDEAFDRENLYEESL